MPRAFSKGGLAFDCKTTAFGRQEPCCKGGVKSSVRAFYASGVSIQFCSFRFSGDQSKDLYKAMISSLVGSLGLPGRQASSIADCARKSISSSFTMPFKS